MCEAGLLKVPGLMPPKCNMFDTPGVPHDFQLSSRLSAEEVPSISPHSSSKCLWDVLKDACASSGKGACLPLLSPP